ncbi:AMP-dependent synthetase [Rhodococcus sp. 06-1059B-a]|nr:class I adenylate-forming enzyme family protein [Rhodococcus sp. 06-1059B-a]OZD59753.1 AMP-dependent synthetase [Rhodococcus sp. 06-1059B-a]
MNESRAETADPIWGERVVDSTYAGHPGRMYQPAPTSFPEMLASIGEYDGRDYLVQGDRRITHTAFRAAIPTAAARLADAGVRPGDRVMLHCYNCPELVLAMWAAWWLGAVPVLANRWWSVSELEHGLMVTDPVLVLSDAPEVLRGARRVEPLGALTVVWDKATVGFPPTRVELDAPALVLFTSGSSGAPKAVELSLRSVVANQHNLLVRSRRLPQHADPDARAPVTLVCTPLFHIGGVSNTLTNLITGGRLVMTTGRFDAGEILRLIESERVQSWGGVPTMAVRVLEHPDFDAHDLSSLRSFPLGGAPIPATLLARMTVKLPQLKERGLANTWGMTETGGFMTVAGNADLQARPGTVGRPYPIVEVRIDQPDAAGSGEILVRAPTVMLGYIGIDDCTVDSAGWLHTGDLGHLDSDGYLYLDGRSKDIVIRGGENIACAHVEHGLLGHPAVAEAAAFGVPHDDLGEELAVAVTVRGGEIVTVADLEAHCRQNLAYFEIPTLWQLSEAPLPTLAGEKLDKKTIRAAYLAQRRT